MWSIKGEPNELVGGVNVAPHKVWSYTGAFHKYLAILGKTNLATAVEQSLLQPFVSNDTDWDKIPYTPNQIFLVEASQLADLNVTRTRQLRRDLRKFLNLTTPLSAEIPFVNGRTNDTSQAPYMDICDAKFAPIHADTLAVARAASQWIRTYFMDLPSVHVSSPEFLQDLLQLWMRDPCQERRRRSLNATSNA